MIDGSTQAGSMVRDSGRAPTRFERGQVCVEPGCSTRLSTYNRRDTCFRHSPIRFPRVRGRVGAHDDASPTRTAGQSRERR